MTSKISYCKFIKSDIRNRGWLAAITAVLLFLLMPVYTLLTLDGMKASAATNGESPQLLELAFHTFTKMLNGSSLPLAIAISLLGLLCAATGFSYLHSKEKQDFYHSMPIRKSQWFAISYVSGLLIFLVPYLIFGFCTILLWQINGLMNQTSFIACLIALLGGILGFLICYHTALLAMFLTGQLVTGVLASLVLFVYGSIITFLYGGLASRFFETWSNFSPPLLQHIGNYASPASLYICINTGTSYRGLSLSVIICTLLCILFLLALSLILCQYYPTEAAERAIAFPRSAPVIKILIVIPTALFAGLLADSLGKHTTNLWIIFIGILMAVLLCLIIEFIYHHDLKQILSGKISFAISIGGVLVILCILQFDVFGYDSYLPKKEKLSSMSIYSDSFSGYFEYPEAYQTGPYDQLNAPGAAIKDYAPLYLLAKEGIENEKQGITPSATDHGKYKDVENITIRFGLSKNQNVCRTYAVDRTKLLDAMKQICKSEKYRKELFPVFHLNRKEILQISAQDIYCRPTKLSLAREQQNQLLDAYEKDVLDADISTLQNEAPLGELQMELPDKSTFTADASPANGTDIFQLGQFYVYESYKNTLGLLKQYGYTFRTKISPEDIMQMTYYSIEEAADDTANGRYTQDAYAHKDGGGIPITDSEKMKEVLSKITYPKNSGFLGKSPDAQGSVEITLTGSPDTIAFQL